MPEYLSPGVYIEELPGPKPIEGVGTSTGAFVGIAERGPVNDPQLITNLTQYADTFGGFIPGGFLAYAVNHFFTEGGTRCYVVRAFKASAATTPNPDLARVTLRRTNDPASEEVMSVFASSEGSWANKNISVRAEPHGFDPEDPKPPATVQSNKKFKLSVFFKGDRTPVEVFDHLSMNEFQGNTTFPNPDHIEKKINGISKYITVADKTKDTTKIDPPFFPLIDPVTNLPNPLPEDKAVAEVLPTLDGGKDLSLVLSAGDANAIEFKVLDLIGEVATATKKATGLQAFDAVDDINIVAIPDLVNLAFSPQDSRDATIKGFNYCEARKDCFFVADTPQGFSPQAALGYRRGVAPSPATGGAFNSKFGAIYYPWFFATDPITGKRKLVPPSGAVAGSYAEADGRVGVHKAPAGTEVGFLNSAVEVERAITKGEQDTLNPEGVNVIRKFPDSGIVIWGARTVSSDPEWRYVNVRRLFNFLEESILKGTQGLVFEPNDPSLWKRIIRDVSAFLKIQWMEGKIIGNKMEQAFFVKCDEETNPPESMDLGRVVTLIGVCPSKPAEFVIFRIKQTRFGGDVEE
jgi:Phage tail sheath protein FI